MEHEIVRKHQPHHSIVSCISHYHLQMKQTHLCPSDYTPVQTPQNNWATTNFPWMTRHRESNMYTSRRHPSLYKMCRPWPPWASKGSSQWMPLFRSSESSGLSRTWSPTKAELLEGHEKDVRAWPQSSRLTDRCAKICYARIMLSMIMFVFPASAIYSQDDFDSPSGLQSRLFDLLAEGAFKMRKSF